MKTGGLKIAACVILACLVLSGCGGADPQGEPTPREIAAQKKVIRDYYSSLSRGRYKDAYDLTSGNYRKGMGYENFVYQYEQFVRDLDVKSITRFDRDSTRDSGVYDVELRVEYRRRPPSGRLPNIHVIQRTGGGQWKIDSMGT